MTTEARTRVTVPAGDYIVGDPCYFVPDDRWRSWLEDANYLIPGREHVLHALVDGHHVVGVSTAYGDGCYEDQDGRDYPVDAGLVGLTALALAAPDWRRDLGHLITFTEPVECFHDAGVIHLGHLTIDTDPAESEDDVEWCASCGLSEAEWPDSICGDCRAEHDHADDD